MILMGYIFFFHKLDLGVFVNLEEKFQPCYLMSEL